MTPKNINPPRPNATMPRVIFRDRNLAVVTAMLEAFIGVEAFDILLSDIFSISQADAIVSPANSYGWMDGGIDGLYRSRFGYEIERLLRYTISKEYAAGVPVGKALVIPTGDTDIPHLISAPTMVVPGPVPKSRNAFLAFRAALIVAREHGFASLLCPGLCTLTGRMDAVESARQMREAWAEVSAMGEVHGNVDAYRDVVRPGRFEIEPHSHAHLLFDHGAPYNHWHR
jgi:O-acetyl-ADP-ribose deacetylase (regulator of RNase III)